ncbi:MAG TPA: formyltransferase family protein [Longimicrobium sp.]|nr:formyltransferase family protein [Longimicrobium sp.]
MNRRVVILAGPGPFTDRLAGVLAERGVRVDALVVYEPEPEHEPRAPASPLQRLGGLALAPQRWVRSRVLPQVARAEPFGKIVLTGAVNGRAMRRDLRRLEPDVVVLSRCARILEPEVLRIPHEGVVNVHPGLLPWVRGNTPVNHSLLRGVPLGATAFRVDPGIDTGAVLERRLLALRGGETRKELAKAIHMLWMEMTADLVARAAAGPLPPGTPQRDRFPLCRTLTDPAERAAVDEALRRGAAKALFERWLPLCEPGTLSLPGHLDARFVPRPGG